MSEELKKAYLKHITDQVNDFDVYDIDGFVDSWELENEEVAELLNLPLKVVQADA